MDFVAGANGWVNLRSAARIRKEQNFINFAAAEAFGALIAFHGEVKRFIFKWLETFLFLLLIHLTLIYLFLFR